ncbi:MAG: glutamine--fructose-6-phosphate transaminase (isomerizing) [Bacteroidales bacterium]|nr:glutamine--fructose-6-phosphate transaminase (isomerizing) [Bacteroidales bacterium]MDD3430457.1 glutamine--fructose-6-phosphate transaminase (isomerizing) [Bacteroidales bacterium]MDD4361695.1 glutamine--fructose-6-phosphate transaminase (isomerizing) [Bacteroidales bacterium]
MCGIVAYIGHREAYPILIKGLHRLEYRGYDSAGIALIDDNEINVYKTKGKVRDLEHFTESKNINGKIGIAHTRWATHGEPNNANAHPHYSETASLALVHNGIIENYTLLKKALQEHGYNFKSDTDTEVLVQLIEYIKTSNNCSLFEAVQSALKQVIGAYAIAVIDKNNKEEIVAARKSSPLVVGLGKEEYFVASDVTPIIEYTNKVVYLNDEEVVLLRPKEQINIVNLNNTITKVDVKSLNMSISQLEKGGYPHFMLKEINEQPKTIIDCIRGRINVEATNVILSGVIDHKDKILNAGRIIIVACGTSWHAALIGKHLIEEFCKIPVEVEYASEFRYRNPVINKGDLMIAISQSGETADTLAAVQLGKEKGAFIYGICNVVGSSIPRATHTGTYIHVGPEIGVASTKAFTGQVTVLTMLAMTIAKEKKSIAKERFLSILKSLKSLPELMEEVLMLDERIKDLSKIFTYAHNFLYLGRGYNYPLALEGALKLKEISYIHAEGYPAAEMKHGPIALIDNEMPTFVIATTDSIYEKTVSNIQEIKARGGKVIALVTKGDKIVSSMADFSLEIPDVDECLSPVVACIPLQLFAYHIAINKGRNVDQPRNLAKSVTVE